MTVRRPLILTGTGNDLIEMTDAQITAMKNQMRYLYSASPSVTLGVVASGGVFGNIADTRYQAGASSTSVSAFPSEAVTAEPTALTVNYNRFTQTAVNTVEPADTSSVAFPVFSNAGNIQSMTATDMYDTFVLPVIDTITSGADEPGTFRIHTATTLTGHTLVSTTPIFTDTKANLAAYTAAGIPEAQDQPVTVTNYYLFQTNASSAVAYELPLFIRSADSNIQQYTTANYNTLMSNFVRHAASEVVGTRIRYSINGAGNNRGSGIANTVLSGVTGNYQTRLININDYRAQEFPNGTLVTAATSFLRITQV